MRIYLFFRLIALLTLLSTGFFQPVFAKTSAEDRLKAIVEDPENPLAGVSLAVMLDGQLIFEGAAGCAQFNDRPRQKCRRTMKSDTKVRVASVSKMVTALTALALVDEGVLDLDRDSSDYLGWTLRNPAFPETPITPRQLMGHVSTVRDPEAYWIVAPALMEEFISEREEIFSVTQPPGDFFSYSNLNYGLLAAVMEKASGQRFDTLVRTRLLDNLDLDAGFNWSGVSSKARRAGASLYRSEDNRWMVQTDDRAILKEKDPHYLMADNLDRHEYLSNYNPGDNATLFSPQGGLRASVIDLVHIIHSSALSGLLQRASEPIWVYDDEQANGDTDGGFFRQYGAGMQTLRGDETAYADRVFTGHAGQAYGLYSGAWMAQKKGTDDIVFAFSITGSHQPPIEGAHSAFNKIEEKLVSLAMEIATKPVGHLAKSSHDDPRPYDATRTAMTDVDAALLAATATGKRVLVVLGANWCHDSRGLAAKFEQPALATLIAEKYELVYVDVGRRDRNLHVGARFGVPEIFGTPTVLILSPEGDILNAESVHEWRTADSKPFDETLAYFEKYAR